MQKYSTEEGKPSPCPRRLHSKWGQIGNKHLNKQIILFQELRAIEEDKIGWYGWWCLGWDAAAWRHPSWDMKAEKEATVLSREELCKQSNGKCKGPGVEMNLVSKWTWCIWGQKGGCCGWSRVRGKAWKRGDEAEEEGRVRSKSDRKLLEDLKQGSWEVIVYILIKALTYILKRKVWLCGE